MYLLTALDTLLKYTQKAKAKTPNSNSNTNKRHAESEANLRRGSLPTTSKAITDIREVTKLHQKPCEKHTRNLQIPINATLNQKKSLRTITTTLPHQPQTPSAFGPSHQPPMAHCTFSLHPRPSFNRKLKTLHHRAQACPAHCTRTGAPTPSYKAASLYGRSQRTGCAWFSPRGNIR